MKKHSDVASAEEHPAMKAESHKDVAKKVGHMMEKATQDAADINHEAKQVKANKPKKTDEKIAEIADKVIKAKLRSLIKPLKSGRHQAYLNL